jgi:parallel beta-helix repeat protein
MSEQKNKIIVVITLAIVSVLLLGGVSFTFFPTQQNTVPTNAPHIMWTAPTVPINPAFVITGTPSNATNSTRAYWVVTVHFPMDTICIEPDGSLNASDAHIQHNGNTYTLTADMVNKTILVQKDNIVLDGAGYTLQGSSQSIGNQAVGISVPNRNNITITNFSIKQYTEPIWLQNSTYITIKNNYLTDGYPYAVLIDYSNNNSIIENQISGAITQLDGSSNNKISENTITNSYTGIADYYGQNNEISKNNFGNDNISIISESTKTVVSENNVLNGDMGILIEGPDYAVFKNNIVECKTGLSVTCTNSAIYENNVNNSTTSIILNSNSFNAETGNNTFYHNNFMLSTKNLEVLNPSRYDEHWDNGKEGNYWSSYNGTDTNKDGVGDTPFQIDGNNTDLYPLMQPYVTIVNSYDHSTAQLFFTFAGVIAAAGVFVTLTWASFGKRTIKKKPRSLNP